MKNKEIEYGCPNFIRAGISMLADEIERVEWNIRQEEYSSPIHNNGAIYEECMPIFRMRAYYWGDDEDICCEPNFKCDDLEISWYICLYLQIPDMQYQTRLNKKQAAVENLLHQYHL